MCAEEVAKGQVFQRLSPVSTSTSTRETPPILRTRFIFTAKLHRQTDRQTDKACGPSNKLCSFRISESMKKDKDSYSCCPGSNSGPPASSQYGSHISCISNCTAIAKNSSNRNSINSTKTLFLVSMQLQHGQDISAYFSYAKDRNAACRRDHAVSQWRTRAVTGRTFDPTATDRISEQDLRWIK